MATLFALIFYLGITGGLIFLAIAGAVAVKLWRDRRQERG